MGSSELLVSTPAEPVGKYDGCVYRHIEFNLKVASAQTRKLKLVLYTPVIRELTLSIAWIDYADTKAPAVVIEVVVVDHQIQSSVNRTGKRRLAADK